MKEEDVLQGECIHRARERRAISDNNIRSAHAELSLSQVFTVSTGLGGGHKIELESSYPV